MVLVSLSNKNDFLKFNGLILENIIHRDGRRLFPRAKFVLTDLDPQESYQLSLSFKQICSMVYSDNSWKPADGLELELRDQSMEHPFGITNGSRWMSSEIDFKTLKITNNENAVTSSTILLNSRHKYVPVLTVRRVKWIEGVWQTQESEKFSFEETAFVTCTRYMERKQADKKIEMNIHAIDHPNRHKRRVTETVENEEEQRPKKKNKQCANETAHSLSPRDSDSSYSMSSNSSSVTPHQHHDLGTSTIPYQTPNVTPMQFHPTPPMPNAFYPPPTFPYYGPTYPTYFQPMGPASQNVQYFYHGYQYPQYY